MLALQAARSWSVRPTAYLDEWGTRDRGLAEGLILYERDLGSHGVPMSRATDGELGTAYEVETGVDHVRAAIERWEAQNPVKKRQPGAFPRLVDNTHLLRARQQREDRAD